MMAAGGYRGRSFICLFLSVWSFQLDSELNWGVGRGRWTSKRRREQINQLYIKGVSNPMKLFEILKEENQVWRDRQSVRGHALFPKGAVVDPRGRKGKDPKSWIDQATELKALTVRQ